MTNISNKNTNQTGRKFPRVTVFLGTKAAKKKTGSSTTSSEIKFYSNMRKTTAEKLGVSPVEPSVDDLKAGKVASPGSVGAGSIKLDFGEVTDKGSSKLYSMPVPANMNLGAIYVFLLSTDVKNRPIRFITRHGVSRYIPSK